MTLNIFPFVCMYSWIVSFYLFEFLTVEYFIYFVEKLSTYRLFKGFRVGSNSVTTLENHPVISSFCFLHFFFKKLGHPSEKYSQSLPCVRKLIQRTEIGRAWKKLNFSNWTYMYVRTDIYTLSDDWNWSIDWIIFAK